MKRIALALVVLGALALPELGHAIATLIPGFAGNVNSKTVKSLLATGEGYSMAFENSYRRDVVGLPKNDIREYYSVPGDVTDWGAGQPLSP